MISDNARTHARRTDAPHRAPLPWVQQLVDIGAFDPATDRAVGGHGGFTGRWANAERLHPDDAAPAVNAVGQLLHAAPRVTVLLTPPRLWGATNVGLACDPATATVDAKVLRTVRALRAQAEGTDFEAEAAYVAAFPNVTPMRSRSHEAAGWWAGRAAADHADIGAGGCLIEDAERKVCSANGGPVSPARHRVGDGEF